MDVQPSPTASSLAQLTSLRFFAALHVLAFHSVQLTEAPALVTNFVNNGYLSVSFFFILSGFILTHSYVDKMSDRHDFRRFAIARFARTYPVYLLALVVALPQITQPFDNPLMALATLGLIQAWCPPTSMNGFFWNSPGWTLSVEFFFYLAFPLLLHLFSRLTSSALWISLAVTVSDLRRHVPAGPRTDGLHCVQLDGAIAAAASKVA